MKVKIHHYILYAIGTIGIARFIYHFFVFDNATEDFWLHALIYCSSFLAAIYAHKNLKLDKYSNAFWVIVLFCSSLVFIRFIFFSLYYVYKMK